jgi:predicted adenine nucleotide alpha hydrolase (AANH) superfamily ATPase
MRVLLHICCGPCAIYPATFLREQNHQVSGFFYNPNIHPYAEYRRRYEAVVAMSERLDLDVIFHRYDFEDFLRRVSPLEDRGQQHEQCWRMRLAETARVAHEQKIEAFTTTLLASPYQDIEAIGRLGREIGAAAGVDFIFQNFRKGFADAHRQSREWKLYHQDYCGCLYSEKESADARAKAIPKPECKAKQE